MPASDAEVLLTRRRPPHGGLLRSLHDPGTRTVAAARSAWRLTAARAGEHPSRLGDAKLVIYVACALAVLVGLGRIACSHQGSGQAVVGAGLLVAVAGPDGDGERSGIAVAGLPGLARREHGVSHADQCSGFPFGVTDLAERGHRLLVITDRLRLAAQVVADLARPGQGLGLDRFVTGLAGQGKGLPMAVVGF
jgi:hypothetical protein